MNRRQISNTALLLLAAGLLAAGTSSCRKDIEFYNTEEDAFAAFTGPEVLFSAYSANIATKGLSYDPDAILGYWDTTSTSYLPGTGIGVFAFYQKAKSNGYPKNFDKNTGTPTFMYNQLLERTSTDGTNYDFEYTPRKYWPNNTNDQISFFAYAPYDETTAWEDLHLYTDLNGTYIRRDYVIDDVVSDQQDYMWADPIMNLQRPATSSSYINFDFKHLCARISVTAVANFNPFTPYLTVDTLSFKGRFYTSGTWEYKLSTNTSAWRSINRESSDKIYYPFREEYCYNASLGRDTSNAIRVTNVESLAHPEDCYMFVLPGTQDISFHYAMSQRNPTTGDIFPYYGEVSYPAMQLEGGKAYNFKLSVMIDTIAIAGVIVKQVDLVEETQNIPWVEP